MSFCIAPAHTDFSTYFPTHSRHDALPTCEAGKSSASAAANSTAAAAIVTGIASAGARRNRPAVARVSRARSASLCAAATTRIMARRSEEHTSELQSLMRISYAAFCLKKTNNQTKMDHAQLQTHIYN